MTAEWWLGRDSKREGIGLIEILARIYLAGPRKTTKSLNQGTDVRVEFRTGYFPSKNTACCRYTSVVRVAGYWIGVVLRSANFKDILETGVGCNEQKLAKNTS
jgi:hypothetical protein